MLLDVATGQERHHLDFKNGVRFHAFSPDGKTVVVTVGIDPGVQLWDVAAGKLIRKLKAQTFRLTFSPDGKLLASAGDNRIMLTDVQSGEEIGRLEAKMDLAMSLAFTPDGKTLLSGNQDGKVRAWDVESKKLRRQLDAHMWMIRDMALSHDGKTVAVGTVYNTLRLWDVATGKELFEKYQGHDAQVNAVAFSPDGQVLASGGDNQQIRLWDPITGKQLQRIKSSARAIAFTPDGKQLASLWTYNNAIRLWNAVTGKEALLLPHEGIKPSPRLGRGNRPSPARVPHPGNPAGVPGCGPRWQDRRPRWQQRGAASLGSGVGPVDPLVGRTSAFCGSGCLLPRWPHAGLRQPQSDGSSLGSRDRQPDPHPAWP
jgi:WD40 repeat protein